MICWHSLEVRGLKLVFNVKYKSYFLRTHFNNKLKSTRDKNNENITMKTRQTIYHFKRRDRRWLINIVSISIQKSESMERDSEGMTDGRVLPWAQVNASMEITSPNMHRETHIHILLMQSLRQVWSLFNTNPCLHFCIISRFGLFHLLKVRARVWS